jgi:protein-tyrosine phosphatase
MIDIHCHILPGLDDGPKEQEMSFEMAEMAVAEGITHVVATPHASPAHQFVPELIDERRNELQRMFEGRLVLGTGCDFHLSYENLQDVAVRPARYTINHKNYLLVEFADFAIPASMDQTLHSLHLNGLRPIITHPERNPLLRTKPERLYRWLRQGCYAQITAQSLLGKFGRAAQDMAKTLMDLRAVHFIASDAHNVSSRPLRLREAYEYVEKSYGEETARATLIDNPMAAFEGKPMVWVPELDDDIGLSPGATVIKKKNRFWFF